MTSFFSVMFFYIAISLSLCNSIANSTLTPINPDLYHSSVDLLEQIKALVHRHQDKLTLETIRGGNKGYQADINVVTYCRSRVESDDRSKFRILLSFGQHGRELITTELAYRILSILSEEQFLPNLDPTSLNRTLDKLIIKNLWPGKFMLGRSFHSCHVLTQKSTHLVSANSEVYSIVVPMENLNGRRLVEEGDLCERRNGRGVDLNRNWSVDWGKKEKDYDPYEENPGTAPFSEPESQTMRKIALSFDPHIWVNVHSGMEALFMPYDHKNTTPDGLPYQRMRSLLSKVNKAHCHERCMIGSGGGSVGYLAHGTATDYMYDIAKVPMAFTFEIYGDDTASSKDCFKMFNPVDHSTFNSVLNDWSAAFFTIFKLGPLQFDETPSKANKPVSEKWISIDEYLDGYLMERRNRYGKKMEVLDLGMQEIRTYFRLFLLSSVLLLCMFCARISKSKNRPIVPAMPL